MSEFTLTPPRSVWPLLFSFKAPIFGHAYVAYVEMAGRLLAHQTGADAVWLDGVNPGGIALSVPNLAVANQTFHAAVVDVLTDFAAQAADFEEFRRLVEQFFADTDATSTAEWESAVRSVQTGATRGPGELPVKPATSAIGVRVVCLESIQAARPELNPTAEFAAAA